VISLKKHTINDPPKSTQPAYVANGFVGLRVGTCPFTSQTALLAGFNGSHERVGVEAYAPVPAVEINLRMDNSSLQKYVIASERPGWRWSPTSHPEGYRLLEQTYDFSCGELTTSFEFINSRGQRLTGTHLIYCSRSSPTIVIQETELEVKQACDLGFSTLMDPTQLPIKTQMTVVPKTGGKNSDECDGVLLIESRDGSTTAGVATFLLCEGSEGFRETRNVWGYEQEHLTKTYSVQAVPGKTYRFKVMTSYVPGILHSEPHWQAVRMIRLALWKGFRRLQEENRKAWEKLWESRIRILGASEAWQDVLDASFFYMYCTIHPSSPQSIAPFGLSQREMYKGHVFWDTESFMFMLPLFTDPNAAKTILEYRFQRLQAAQHNAMINGYRGIQFPWQSGTTGDEVTTISAGGAAGTGEQHINLDVAMAFIAYYQVSGDEIFLRERAWPVLKGVAEWIESRAEKTNRGYEILFVTGIDEGSDNVNNDSYTNILSKIVLNHVNRFAEKLGYPMNPIWKQISDDLYVPIHGGLNFVEQYENCQIKDSMPPESLMAFFPYGYSYSRQVDENTMMFYIEHGLRRYLSLPMLSGFLGVIPAYLGDRKLAREFFEEGNLRFFIEPYLMCTERALTGDYYKRVPDAITTTFLTGRGSMIAGLMMGLSRIDLWKEDLDDWFSGPIVMPEGWDGIVMEKVYLRGRPARITAMHGAPRAQVEWLDIESDRKT